MAGIAIGISGMVKGNVAPITGAVMAVAALPRPMSRWTLMAQQTITITGMIKRHFTPACGGVALAALASIMAVGRLVAA